MNSYTEAELKFFQSQIRTLNFNMGKMLKAGKVGDTAGALLDDLIEVQNMTEKGFARYGLQYLKGLTESEIETYIENIDRANDLINLMRSEDEINKILEGAGSLSDPESVFWRLFANLKDSGVELDSDLVKELVDESMDGKLSSNQLREHVLNFLEVVRNPDYGLASFEEKFNMIRTLR